MHSGRIVIIRNAQESVPRHDAEQPVRGRDRTVLPDVLPHKIGVSGRKLNLPRLPAERHRLALHAETLRFAHPITRNDMNFISNVPSQFYKYV